MIPSYHKRLAATAFLLYIPCVSKTFLKTQREAVGGTH